MNFLVEAWYKKAGWLSLLKPLSALYAKISDKRRLQYRSGEKPVYKAKIPVIVVGNISAGGTGKTPLVIYLALALKEAGYRPGIVSRGYLSKARQYPYLVTPQSTYKEAGDEALLIAHNTQCPVIIDANRAQALQKLEQDFDCNVVLSDDGLQHYAMARDIEIAVIDGVRGFGNGKLLPEGPLRELPTRLDEVDFVVCNGVSSIELPPQALTMTLETRYLYNLKSREKHPFNLGSGSELLGPTKKVHAVAGIGNPERFFTSLCACGFDIISHVFKDHYPYSKSDITFDDDYDVVMTEKDAVKCFSFASSKDWYLKVEAVLDESFIKDLLKLLKLKEKGKAHHE